MELVDTLTDDRSEFKVTDIICVLLNLICSAFAISVDPYQLASRSESALFVIKYVNLYRQLGSSNLIG